MINLEWVYYENVIKGHSEGYLFDLLRTGNLQPYDQNGEQIYCPKECHEYFYLLSTPQDREGRATDLTQIVESEWPDEDEDPTPVLDFTKKLSWEFLRTPTEDKVKMETLRSILKNSKFMKSEFDNLIMPEKVEKQKSQKQNEGQIPVPADTEWYDISIKFVDDKKIKITPGRGRTLERSYKDFGCFHNKNSKNPRLAWWHLVAMGLYEGNPSKLMDSKEEITKKQISDLQIALKCLFPGVVGNQFEKHVKGIGWKPRISLTFPNNFPGLY
jgi:hypothetical protein